jgi:hypothetical protein
MDMSLIWESYCIGCGFAVDKCICRELHLRDIEHARRMAALYDAMTKEEAADYVPF